MSHPVTVSEQLRGCDTPQAALILLADRLDYAIARIAELQQQLDAGQPADAWQQPLDWSGGIEVASYKDALKEQWVGEPHLDEMAELQQRIAVETDPDEVRALKAQLWLLKHPGLEQGRRGDAGRRVSVDGNIKDLPVPDAARMLMRRQWAKTYRLWEFFTPAQDEAETVEAYAKGGPLWLYHSDNQLCLQLPLAARQQMVEDVDQDSPQEAREIGRDLLKAKEGVTQKFATDAINQMAGVDG